MHATKRLSIVTLILVACAEDGSPLDAGPGSGDAAAADAGAVDVDVRPPPSCEGSLITPCPPRGHATWPMPNPPSLPLPHPSSFENIGAEIARDRVTGLHWHRRFTDKLSWPDAEAHCLALRAGGHADWRVPSRIELVSLVDFTLTPTADSRSFPDTAPDYFWSSSPVPFLPDHAFSVYFGAGLTAYGKMAGASAHVRCVRGGVPGQPERFRVGAEDAEDLHTGLRWQRGLAAGRLTWDAATVYCDTLDLAGSQRWRLPSTKELQTILDETRTPPLIDPQVFTATPAERFWTGSPINKGNVESVTYVDFAEGISEEATTSDALHVRCVR